MYGSTAPNARAGELANGGIRITPAWAVGSWFIPFANLVMPFRAIRELWKSSHGGPSWQHRSTWHVIGWWWAFWIAGNVHVWFGPNEFGLGLGVGSSGVPSSLSGVINRDTWEILSFMLRVVSAVLAIAIVRSIVKLQGAAPAAPAAEEPIDASLLSPPRPLPTLSTTPESRRFPNLQLDKLGYSFPGVGCPSVEVSGDVGHAQVRPLE